VRLPFGTTSLEIPPIPGLRVLLPNTRAPERPQREILSDAIASPLGAPPLREIARGRRDAVILISCRTRRTGSHLYVPLLLDALNAGGIPDERILVLAATGTHANWRDDDAPLLLGDAAGRVRVMSHDAQDARGLAEVGVSSFGNRILLNRRYLDADLKIATGRVTYHYFAGFTAGPKAILPGVAGYDTIVANHRRILERDGDDVRIHAETRNGNLETNPVHREMCEAARMAPPDFSMLTVLNAANEMTAAFGGETFAAHARAVDAVRDADAPWVDAPADLALVSCGGAPLDVNFVQSLKALANCEAAVRPGGAIVLAAECPDGARAALLEATAIADDREFARRVAAATAHQLHNAPWIRRISRRAHVIMISHLSPAAVDALGFHRAETIGDALALAQRLAGTTDDAIAVPHGNITYVRVRRMPASGHGAGAVA
jgi:nickel-dependent lactate racemase